MGMIMEREMSKDKMQTAITWLMRDIVATEPKLFNYIGFDTMELNFEDFCLEYNVNAFAIFFNCGHICRIKSFMINVKTRAELNFLYVREINYTTDFPVGFGHTEIEGCKKLDDFDEQQLLDILQTEIKILAIASGSVPQWFLDGYEEESDWLADQEKERR